MNQFRCLSVEFRSLCFTREETTIARSRIRKVYCYINLIPLRIILIKMIIHFNQFYVTNLLSNILLAPRKFTRYSTMKRSSLKLNLFASLHSAHKSCSSAAGRSAKSVLLIVSRRVTWNSYSYTQHIYMYRVSR